MRMIAAGAVNADGGGTITDTFASSRDDRVPPPSEFGNGCMRVWALGHGVCGAFTSGCTSSGSDTNSRLAAVGGVRGGVDDGSSAAAATIGSGGDCGGDGAAAASAATGTAENTVSHNVE